MSAIQQLPPAAAPDCAALLGFLARLRDLERFSVAVTEESGLTPPLYQLLLALAAQPAALDVTRAAEILRLRYNTVSELAKRADGLGFVRRTNDPLDRRRTVVSLTEKGLELVRALAERHQNELVRVYPRLMAGLQGLTVVSDGRSAPS